MGQRQIKVPADISPSGYITVPDDATDQEILDLLNYEFPQQQRRELGAIEAAQTARATGQRGAGYRRVPVDPAIHPSGYIDVPGDATDDDVLDLANRLVEAKRSTPRPSPPRAAAAVAQAQPEVVSLDDKGQENVFPPGFDPERAAQIVKQQNAKGEDFSKFGPMSQLLKDQATGGAESKEAARRVFGWVRRNPGAAGAIAGSIAALPLSAGASALPAIAAIEGAAGFGGALVANEASRALDPENTKTQKEILGEAVLEGTTAAALSAAGPALQGVGRGLYHLALKPRLAYSQTPKQVAELVETGLREGINVSAGGYQKAGRLVGDISNNIKKLLKSLGATSDPARGFEKIAQLKAKYRKEGALPEELRAVDDVDAYYNRAYGEPMSVEAMHDLKQGIWKRTENAWDQSVPTAKKDAMKAFGSGLRQEIEEVGRRHGITDIAEQNARSGELIALRDAIAGRVVQEPVPVGLRQGMEMVAGAGRPGYLVRAVATSSPVLSAAGRAASGIGKRLDPRSYRRSSTRAISDENRLLPTSSIAGEDETRRRLTKTELMALYQKYLNAVKK